MKGGWSHDEGRRGSLRIFTTAVTRVDCRALITPDNGGMACGYDEWGTTWVRRSSALEQVIRLPGAAVRCENQGCITTGTGSTIRGRAVHHRIR
ncbi:hypothetical protein KCP73_01475 [Salmonella enterica subsp. enterica]|nr:hypothetical protein KCP73_01475 [Salmonella enterica subsp. enterica]